MARLLGDTAYTFSLYLNTLSPWCAPAWDFPMVPFTVPEHRVKDAVAFWGDFEDTLLEETRRGQHHGSSAGTYTPPAIRNLKDAVYCNRGTGLKAAQLLSNTGTGLSGS